MIASELGFGKDFAGAVKEKQGRADCQLFNTWGKFLPAQDQFTSWFVPRLAGIIGKGWEECYGIRDLGMTYCIDFLI